MNSQTDTLIEQLRSIDPVSTEDLNRSASDPAARELLQAILASDPQRPSRRLGSRSRRRGVPAAAVALAAVALVALIVGLPGGGGDRGTLPALARVAEAAAAQPPPDTGLPYLYVKTRGTYIDTSVAGGRSWSNWHSEIDEEWIAKDGSGRLRRVEAPARFVGPKDREAWEAAGRPNFLAFGWNGHSEEQNVPAGHFDDHLLYGGGPLSELPTDPTELAEWLTQRVTDPKANAGAGNGFPISVRTLTLASEILNNPLATPQLRAALYEAEGQIPGIEYLGSATDAIGRRGVAVGAESANSGAPTLYSLIFDPRTSQVLATEEETLEPPAGLPNEKTPLLTSAKLFLSSGTTGSLTSRP